MMGDYTLGIKELDDAVGGIKKGSNLIMIGPPMNMKKIILYNFIYHGAAIDENAVIALTTNDSGTHILDWFRENKLSLPLSRIGIIDCTTKFSGGAEDENENIRMTGSPVDLTGMGLRISEFLEIFQMKKNVQSIQLHVNSISTILMYSNIQTVFRFVHVFTGRIRSAGGLGIFVMEK